LKANGFERGKNGTCIYIYRLVLKWIEDLTVCGRYANDWKSGSSDWGVYKTIQNPFQVKDLIIVEEGHTEDYLSMEVTLIKQGLYLSMQEYAAKVVDFM
jgi:hypothetical protein